ncbi:hypothetical protein HYALB_00006191 [Hymenoscyphus albidus]|uniref:F-box domain-containing protein n=1 Tax=Hymenoscyphus albidus TaxID=595503 RepID=A0A9N9LIG5_9HELO|nr:hypothetical protein HYALB_00006191 [Hymenoscyphus albidus]
MSMSTAIICASSMLIINSTSRSSHPSATTERPSLSKSESQLSKPIPAPKSPSGRKSVKLRNLISSRKNSEKDRDPNVYQPLLSPASLASNEDENEDEGPNRNNSFTQLVPEVLQYIATFLRPCEAAILSLVCKDLYSKIGTGYLFAMTSNTFALPHTFESYFHRRNFLVLLSQDMIGKRFCEECGKIHAYTPPNLRSRVEKKTQKRPCDAALRRQTTPSCYNVFTDSRLNFASCEDVMKKYRKGMNVDRELSELNYCRIRPTPFYKRIRWHQTRTCKIKDGSLLVRSYFKIFIPFGTDAREITQRTGDLIVCSHLYRSAKADGWFDLYIASECSRGLMFLDPQNPRYRLDRGAVNEDTPETEDEDPQGGPANSSVVKSTAKRDPKSLLRSLLPRPHPHSDSSSTPTTPLIPPAAPIRACPHCPTEHRAGPAPIRGAREGQEGPDEGAEGREEGYESGAGGLYGFGTV